MERRERRGDPRCGADADRAWAPGARLFKDLEPADLLGACYRELFERTGVDPAQVDDAIAGCCFQFGPQGLNIARNAWLQEGLPVSVPGTTVDRQCGSAQQAVNFAAMDLADGSPVRFPWTPQDVAGIARTTTAYTARSLQAEHLQGTLDEVTGATLDALGRIGEDT